MKKNYDLKKLKLMGVWEGGVTTNNIPIHYNE